MFTLNSDRSSITEAQLIEKKNSHIHLEHKHSAINMTTTITRSDNSAQHQPAGKTPLQLISQGTCLPGIPRHPTFAAHRQWLLEQMALAFRVFARKGYTDGMAGHISVRDPENPHTFWTVSKPSGTRDIPMTSVVNLTFIESLSRTLRHSEGERYDPRQLPGYTHRW